MPMTPLVTIDHLGLPIAKARHRHGRGKVYTPESTKTYAADLGWMGKQAMMKQGTAKLIPPYTCPLLVHIMATFAPKGLTVAEKHMIQIGALHPDKKPDIDNVIKNVLDGLNHIVWSDDAKIVELLVRKRYGEPEGVHIEVFKMPMRLSSRFDYGDEA